MNNFVKICIFLISFTLISQNKRPNVLLITTDQHTVSALSAMGNSDISTPNIDRIANRGTIFNKAYVTFPLCSPSRASMFTGKMPHELGIYSNLQAKIDKNDFKTGLGQIMSDNGYDCVYGGKWHVPEIDIPNNIGFKNIADSGDEGLAEKCIEYLNNAPKKPFFMVASFVNPHDICEYARNQRLPNGEIDEIPVHDCPNLPINHAIGAYESEIIRLEQKLESKVYPTANYSDDDWRKYISAYYRLIEKVDFEIGKILNALDKNGLDNNTIVIFTADHGDGMSAHHWNQKTVLFEESVHVPLIVRNPFNKKPQERSNELVSVGLDIMPTILSIANTENSSDLLGHSIMPLTIKEKSNHDFVVVETMFDGANSLQTKGRALITKKFKYVIYEQGKNREQLFDLEKDPFEITNLATNARHKKQLVSMRKKLYDWCIKTNDLTVMKRLLIY
tara:strand:+ start:9337 stop:10680 length:1344 start_codon:yes stop_codon:yes gene_type:complete